MRSGGREGAIEPGGGVLLAGEDDRNLSVGPISPDRDQAADRIDIEEVVVTRA